MSDTCSECGTQMGDGDGKRKESEWLDGVCVVCSVDEIDREMLREIRERADDDL